MARLKKSSAVYGKALKRKAGMMAITPAINFGNGISMQHYEDVIAETQQALETYNARLSDIDALYNTFLEKEKKLREWNERMLQAVSAMYGPDSNQYEMAGGARKSERKRPGPKRNIQ